MRKLSLITIGLVILGITYFTAFSHVEIFRKPLSSPHGKDFKISCDVCHGSKGWALDKAIYSFDHSTTNFSLIGQHKEVNCKLCHTTLVFSEERAKKECVNCHTDIHSQSVGNYCDKCHTPRSWIVNNIREIHQQSRFPLLGVHTMTECQECHKSETLHRYDVRGVECIDCHQEDYLATTNPNHISSNFSTDCSLCHYIYSPEWAGIGLNHSFFPLTQGHNVACSQCHVNNNFSHLETACVSCHLPDYNAATNPVHTGDCFPTNCELCHTTAPGWGGGSFSHNSFPLTSGHSNVNCVQCHVNGNCSSISSECVSCHLPDYNATINPVHTSGCYPTNCTMCHSTNPGWSPTSFQHNNYFPISSGKHSGFACNQCHTNPNDCSVFSCIDCHEHNQSETNGQHDEVGGYTFNSNACYTCHPQGNGGD